MSTAAPLHMVSLTLVQGPRGRWLGLRAALLQNIKQGSSLQALWLFIPIWARFLHVMHL